MRITKLSVVGLHTPFAASYVGAHTFVAQGLLASVSTGSGAPQQAGATLNYDQDLRPSDIRYTNTPSGGSASTAAEQQPTYDGAGNVQTLTTTLAAVGTSAGGTETQAFCYDWANRLTYAGTSGTEPCGSTGSEGISGAGYSASYTYDALGRITSASVLNASGGSLVGAAQGSYTYDATHVHGVASVGSGSTGYAASYDAAGNMTCRAVGATSCGSGNEQMTYDPLGRLLTWQNAASAPTASEQYAYDGSGQRVWQQASSTSSNKTTTTSITYVLGVEEVSTTVVGNKQPVTGTLSYYALLGGLSASRDGSGLIVQMTDLLGTPIAALNLATGLVGEQLRTPYGQARYSAAASSGGGMHTTFGFTGQREDTQAPGSSGLYYFNARYYDPVVGRFTSADPARPDLGGPWGTDAYGYVRGRVETTTDPSGHCDVADECVGEFDFLAAAAEDGMFADSGTDLGGRLGKPRYNLQELANDEEQALEAEFPGWGAPDIADPAISEGDLAQYRDDAKMDPGQFESTTYQDETNGSLNEYQAQERADQSEQTQVPKGPGSTENGNGNGTNPTTTETQPTTNPGTETTTSPGTNPTSEGCSFSADTPVVTPQGERAIGSLQVGDQVEAYNPTSGKAEAETVQHVWINHDHDLVDVHVTATTKTATLVPAHTSGHGLLASDDVAAAVHLRPSHTTNTSGETIHTTANHPWLTADRGWVAAGHLVAGERVVRADDTTAWVVAVQVVPGAGTMYNLTVSHLHTFAVGIGHFVVHNTCTDEQFQQGAQQAKRVMQNEYGYETDTWKFKGVDNPDTPDPMGDPRINPDRYYFRFRTPYGDVKISGNFDESTGSWDGGFHLSDGQYDGPNGYWQNESRYWHGFRNQGAGYGD